MDLFTCLTQLCAVIAQISHIAAAPSGQLFWAQYSGKTAHLSYPMWMQMGQN